MLKIKATKDGSFDFAIDRINLGYWTKSQKGSYLYFRDNSIYIGWDKYNSQIYFDLELHIGRLRINADM